MSWSDLCVELFMEVAVTLSAPVFAGDEKTDSKDEKGK